MKKILLPILVFSSIFSSNADEASISKNIPSRLKDFPSIESVKKMPIPGIYEIKAGSSIYYSDENGDYLIVGSIFDTKNSLNLTELRNKSISSSEFKNFPFQDAIKSVRGDGSRVMVIFADPNCGFCRELERRIEKIENLTVYTFLYPILGVDSKAKSRNIFCSSNQAQAWTNWMIKGNPAPDAPTSCTAVALERNLALGRRLKITGTPALLFPNGQKISGVTDEKSIESALK